VAAAAPEKSGSRKFVKANTLSKERRVVFGLAMVTKESGVEYFDTDNQSFTPDAMIDAAIDWSANGQLTNDMHDEDSGCGVFSFPIDEAIKKAFGIDCDWEGLMIGYRPTQEVFEKFLTGEYTGFSVEGLITNWEDLD
jgi:hypothetical protein